MARGFDELNAPEKYSRSVPFDIYFGEMDITEEQKEKRIAVAEELDELMLFLFALIVAMLETDSLDRDYILIQVNQRYLQIAGKYVDVDKYVEDYIKRFSDTFIQTTFDSIDDLWYLSADRASFIAENESETTWNYEEYKQAIKSGKTKKKWDDVRDSKERKTHREVGGTIIPIEDTFAVGNSLMRYPKDDSLGADAKEIINCRCTIKYI